MTRFDPTIDELKKSLAWHAEVTVDLQRRLGEVRQYALSRGDHALLQLTGTEEKAE